MKYAEVAVNAPGSHQHSFSYSIPPTLGISIGHAVWVPFGNSVVQGVVIATSDSMPQYDVKEISDLIYPLPLISSERINLALWIANYYCAPLFDSVALMLPPSFERRLITYISINKNEEHDIAINISENAGSEVLKFIQQKKQAKIPITIVEKVFGKKKVAPVLSGLMESGLLKKVTELEAVKVKPKTASYLKININDEELQQQIERLIAEKYADLVEILQILHDSPVLLSESDLLSRSFCSKRKLRVLLDEGMVTKIEIPIDRNPLYRDSYPLEFAFELNESQQKICQDIESTMQDISNGTMVYLLQGVTGSGKTEIYLRLFNTILEMGKRGICLIPEISLTPQILGRFMARFPGKVSILNSSMTLGEQYDAWNRINNGSADIVIGSRSAIFSPLPNIGLIIIDEEHEWAYKQSDALPRYNAREVAIKLAELTGAVVILGSATPDICSYNKALAGEYRLVVLKERAFLGGMLPLPEVTVVNLTDELKSGNRSLFSRLLMQDISAALERKEQIILYINRRGHAVFIECLECGFVPMCRNCNVPLTFHSATNKLICHRCSRAYKQFSICPRCGRRDIRYLGIGTERVEAECKIAFPSARVIRLDGSTVKSLKDYQKMLGIFSTHAADIIVGTQMIAKGHDFPLVSVVGVINADAGLNLPDYRAGERTFQLLCQVSGRAGRGSVKGKSIIQTYNPEHYIIKCAAKQDYAMFYQHEIEYRKVFGYPPVNDLIKLLFSNSSQSLCKMQGENMKNKIQNIIDIKGITGIKVLGPLNTFYSRVKGKYQMQILLIGNDLHAICSEIDLPRGWVIDVDPSTVL